jgi:hypothetical protein
MGIKLKKSIVVTFITLILFACSTSSEFAWKEQRAVVEMDASQLENVLIRGLAHWKRRFNKNDLIKALNNFETAFNTDTELPKILSKLDLATYLSRGYYQLGDYHEQDQGLKMQAYKIGGEWAQRGFALNKYFQTAIGDRGHFAPGLKFLEKEYVGVLYWYLANIGKWALSSGVNTTIKYRNLFYDISHRIIELNENYYGGGIYRILGAFYAVLPSYAGGNLDKSWDYFQKSLKIGPDYLGTKILMAQAFAVYRNDLPLFEKIIQDVMKTKLDSSSEIYPENSFEQQKAFKLNADKDALFE